MDTRVTTIIANFNYERFLPNAINSALNQTYPTKICIVDDGSDIQIDELNSIIFEEGEIEFVTSYKDIGTVVASPKKTLIKLYKNYGPSRARNIGIKYFWSSSEAFMILDADDLMMPNKIERFVEEFEKDKDNIGVVYGDYLIYDLDKKTTVQEFKKPYDKRLLNFECIVHSNSLVSKLALETCGLYDELLRVCEDYDLWKRVSKQFMIIHIPEFLSIVTNHKDNSTFSVSEKVWKECYNKVMSK